MSTSRKILSPRRKRGLAGRILFQSFRLAVSFLYLILAAMLILFGYIFGWDIGPHRPVVGVLMMVAGVVVFILGPRAIKRLTGQDPIAPPLY